MMSTNGFAHTTAPNVLSTSEHWVWVTSADDDRARLKVTAYRKYWPKWVLGWLLIVVTIGIARLIFFWRPQWWVWLTSVHCAFCNADCVIVKDEHDQWFVRPMKHAQPANVLRQKWLTKDDNGVSLDHSDTISPSLLSLDSFAFPEDGGSLVYHKSYHYFELRKVLYVWIADKKQFQTPRTLDFGVTCAYFHNCAPLDIVEVLRRRAVFKLNQIVVKLKPIWLLLFQEVLSPFYLFQIFSICLWIYENYEIYAVILFVISASSVTLAVYQIRKNTRALRDTLHTSDMVTVERDGRELVISAIALVPGDIFILTRNATVPCDAVLLTGSCIINEAMLTGESVPETKTPVPEENVLYHQKLHAKHTLFNGTKVLQTRTFGNEKVRAIATRTGFYTLKGQLVRSIMYPKPIASHFTNDLSVIIGLMSLMAVAGFIYTVVSMVADQSSPKDIIVKALDLITIAVPPALPIALTIGIMLARQRLRKQQIFCISPNVINTCGGINAVVFDKTGTLTEDGLSFHCAVPVIGDAFDGEITKQEEIGNSQLLEAMACCHSLTYIEGEIIGDPVDLILFQVTGWKLLDASSDENGTLFAPTVIEEPNRNRPSIGILRQFVFSSNLQRMAVLTRSENSEQYVAYFKGAPEKIVQLSRPASVPTGFTNALQMYTKSGYRVLAYACRRFTISADEAQKMTRDEVERDMEFLGLVVMENRLKPETAPVITSLLAANIRCVMCTGDNLLTAISVARQCGLVAPTQTLCKIDARATLHDGSPSPPEVTVDFEFVEEPAEALGPRPAFGSLKNLTDVEFELGLKADTAQSFSTCLFAMTGDSFGVLTTHFADLLPKVVCRSAVFARMSPDQKTQVIHNLQACDYIVAMCGDGANDVGALKAAHAGISLSEAEASIASPFTSKNPNIECVRTVIREGRAALVTSLGLAKYMAMYSMIEFLAVCLLYSLRTNLGQYQFLYEDLFLALLLATTFGYTDAADRLHPSPPAARILSVTTIASLGIQLLIVFAFQLFVFEFVTDQPFFVPFAQGEEVHVLYQGTCLFLMNCYQILALAVVFSKSFPHRRTVINNYVFSGLLAIGCASTLWISLNPPPSLEEFLEMHTIMFYKYKAFILLLGFLYFLVALIFEDYVVDILIDKYCVPKFQKIPKYKSIISSIKSDPNWVSTFRRHAAADDLVASDVTVLYHVNELKSNGFQHV